MEYSSDSTSSSSSSSDEDDYLNNSSGDDLILMAAAVTAAYSHQLRMQKYLMDCLDSSSDEDDDVHQRSKRRCITRKRKRDLGDKPSVTTAIQKSEGEWRTVLSPEQFRILRQKGTESPGTGEYNNFFGDGVYNCAGSRTPLYKGATKFNSGCGWPAFFDSLPGVITRTANIDSGKTEIACGHLGHVFKGEGFKTPTDERHCVNSTSVKFVPESTRIGEVVDERKTQ